MIDQWRQVRDRLKSGSKLERQDVGWVQHFMAIALMEATPLPYTTCILEGGVPDEMARAIEKKRDQILRIGREAEEGVIYLDEDRQMAIRLFDRLIEEHGDD